MIVRVERPRFSNISATSELRPGSAFLSRRVNGVKLAKHSEIHHLSVGARVWITVMEFGLSCWLKKHKPYPLISKKKPPTSLGLCHSLLSRAI
jgi:hypothetical protein